MRGASPARTARARQLRRTQTDPERKLWFRLNNRQLGGCKFGRQEPIGPYIADFACRERRLIVELDGSQHCESEHDRKRDAYLISLGYRVLRFWNAEVLRNMDDVLETIFAALASTSPRVRGEVESARQRRPGEGASQDGAHPDTPPHPVASRLGLSPHRGER